MTQDPIPTDCLVAFLFWLHWRFLPGEGVDDILKLVHDDATTKDLDALRKLSPHTLAMAEETLQNLLMIVHDDGPVAEEDVAMTFDESRGEA